MHTHKRVGPLVSDAKITSEQRLSRIRTLKIFGGLHIGLGVVCGILSVVGTIVSVRGQRHDYRYNTGYYVYYDYQRQYSNTLSFITYIVSAAFSGWFILTGSFPFCMTLKRESSWKCLKIAFLVCCIISAVVFGFTLLILSVIVGIVNGADDNIPVMAVSICLAVLSFVELIIAIVAASYCCCCSQLYTSQVAIFMSDAHYGVQQSQMQSGYQQANVPNWATNAPHMIQQHQTPVFPHTEPHAPPQGTSQHVVYSGVPVTQQPIPQQAP